MKKSPSAESGFIILMGMLLLVLGSATWFATMGSLQSSAMSLAKDESHIAQLHRIKEKMLTYAVLHSELYAGESNIPGVGYFPCPDADTPCGRDSAGTDELFVLGMVPSRIDTPFFSFIDSTVNNHDYWFAVDSRFVSSSAQFETDISHRYSPLTVDLDRKVSDASGSMVTPMTLDGQNDIVMVLFYAGSALSSQSRPSSDPADYLEQGTVVNGSTFDFSSTGGAATFNDYVIKITRREWEAAVLSRISQDNAPEDAVPDLCASTDPIGIHWFNECKYTGVNIPPFSAPPLPSTCASTGVIAEQNITGQGWRDIICP
ncbi:MAG: hypothetical protein GXO35_01250 [Gammaproteobacteria bacterium]|nr:hypothetical protein [Gammaproteobacteria bacterium]